VKTVQTSVWTTGTFYNAELYNNKKPAEIDEKKVTVIHARQFRDATSGVSYHFDYRALITDKTLCYCLTTFLNIATTNGVSITRCQQPANVMIEKDKGCAKHQPAQNNTSV
jgi:hypothetical protein